MTDTDGAKAMSDMGTVTVTPPPFPIMWVAIGAVAAIAVIVAVIYMRRARKPVVVIEE